MSIGAHGQCNIEAHQKRYKTLKNQQKSAKKVSLKHLNYSPIGTHWSILHGIPTEISQQTHIMAKNANKQPKSSEICQKRPKIEEQRLKLAF